jgi:hypothetical protein
MLLALVPLSGCAWLRGYVPASGPQAPQVISQAATLDQVIQAVNNNSARINTFSTANARISTPGLPSVPANIAIERPRRFRLRASTALTGPEIDLGSNDDLLWFWIRRAQPAALYFCRHDQFASSAARQVVPVDPEWLIQALGITSFEPSVQHVGPRQVAGGKLEIRSTIPSPEGNLVKITLVDASYGWVVEQHLYTQQGQRIASAMASGHRYDPQSGVSLPQQVEIQMPSAQLNLKIDLGDYQINSLSGNPAELWALPNYEGYPMVDLGNPNLRQSLPESPGPSLLQPPPAQKTAWPLSQLPQSREPRGPAER